ncbi:Uncharacterised protein [Mycobacteroides abscessus subsp. abscessus]|nr:Uncharacterised protein [Mycobacteroides abscessus subsp. abscessus]SKX54185.1 Uncharacterised protein [Mycobacteroides abscessus subsp. abscessus]
MKPPFDSRSVGLAGRRDGPSTVSKVSQRCVTPPAANAAFATGKLHPEYQLARRINHVAASQCFSKSARMFDDVDLTYVDE